MNILDKKVPITSPEFNGEITIREAVNKGYLEPSLVNDYSTEIIKIDIDKSSDITITLCSTSVPPPENWVIPFPDVNVPKENLIIDDSEIIEC